MKKVIISPPFGNYIERDWATSVKGTFTLNRRWGLWWRVLTTLRKTEGGWINDIGLRNKGIKNVSYKKLSRDNQIISIAGTSGSEWMQLIDHLSTDTLNTPTPLWTELNVSCPNVTCDADVSIFWMAVSQLENVCVKVAPTHSGCLVIEHAYRAGIRTVHIGNSHPTKRGGESGLLAKTAALNSIAWAKDKYPDLTIIGGGGIYTPRDARDYRDAGVDHYSLSTIWFTPSKVEAVKEEIYEADGSTP